MVLSGSYLLSLRTGRSRHSNKTSHATDTIFASCTISSFTTGVTLTRKKCC